jgi:hypothetical protein
MRTDDVICQRKYIKMLERMEKASIGASRTSVTVRGVILKISQIASPVRFSPLSLQSDFN